VVDDLEVVDEVLGLKIRHAGEAGELGIGAKEFGAVVAEK
jgi:hypothetical protein